MCVVILKQPGFEIPEKSIETAVRVNDDGFGISYVDKGRIVTHKEYNPKLTAADVLKHLKPLKDKLVLLHLRIKTKGMKDDANCHPFTVTTQKEGPYDIVFAHNGTLSGFGNEKDSDTKEFVETIVKPLVLRETSFHRGKDPNPVHRPFVEYVLKCFAGYGSKFVMMDSRGRTLTINKESGENFAEGCWASNGHSVRQETARPARNHYTNGKYDHKLKRWVYDDEVDDERFNQSLPGFLQSGGTSDNVLPFDPTTKTTTNIYGRPAHGSVPSVPLNSGKSSCGVNFSGTNATVKAGSLVSVLMARYHALIDESATFRTGVSILMNQPSPNPNLLAYFASTRKKFHELAGVDSLDFLQKLDLDDIAILVKTYPEHASTAIADLVEQNMLLQRRLKIKDMREGAITGADQKSA